MSRTTPSTPSSPASSRSSTTPSGSATRLTDPFDRLRPILLTGIRVVLGYLLIRHGLDKFDTGLGNVGDAFDGWGVPLPDLSATAVAFIEVIGGAALIAGVATRFVAIAAIGVLVGAIWFVKADIGVLGGAETDLAYIAGLAALVAFGPGRWSVDRVIGLDRSRDVDLPTVEQHLADV
ncbi:MAG: DoxX family protein [Actinomycetota bacterium]